MIKIKATPKNGFWRGGVHHPHGWKEYPDGYFKPEQLKAIENEPLLTVVYADDEPDFDDFGTVEGVLGDAAEEATPEPDPGKTEEAPEPDPGDSGEAEPPKLEAFLADGTTPRCQHVSDSGNQCRYGAAEDSLWCESHQGEHLEG